MGITLPSRVGAPFWPVSQAKRQAHYTVHSENLELQPGMFWKFPVQAPWIVTANIC